MKKNKHSLKISRSFFGETTLDGYPIATYSNDEFLKSVTIIQYTIKGRFMNR